MKEYYISRSVICVSQSYICSLHTFFIVVHAEYIINMSVSRHILVSKDIHTETSSSGRENDISLSRPRRSQGSDTGEP
jgi:hypothetical protein